MTKKQRIAAITWMALKGYSFRHAAVELHTTRSTIAGLASREGIKFSGRPGPKPETDAVKEQAVEPVPKAKAPKAQAKPAPKPCKPKPTPKQEMPVEAIPAPEPIPEPALEPSNDNAPGNLLLVDRERWQCAYPLWDEFPGPDKAFCCGKPVKEGTSYCPAHAEILLVPPKRKRLAPFARGATK